MTTPPTPRPGRTVRRGSFHRSCRRCGWNGTYDTAGKANYAKRSHSCQRWLDKAASAERGRLRAERVDRTPKPCLHKIANHQHGTYACYTLDACRCQPCATAVREYERDRTRQQAYGRWDNYVDAQPARDHVRRLMDAGMGLKRVSAASNVATGVMWKLLYGRPRPDGTRTPSRRITKAVEARILAVELDLADGANVPNTDTARRLQSLVANGWSMSKLATLLGIGPGNFNPVITGRRPQVTVATARAVHALYLQLADQAPPEDTHHDRVAASRARNHAAARGWQPPLRIGGRLLAGTALPLPDIETPNDDLEADPTYDEAAVERRLGGDRSARLTKAERVEIVRRARDAGWSYSQIEARTGINKPERYIHPAPTGDAA